MFGNIKQKSIRIKTLHDQLNLSNEQMGERTVINLTNLLKNIKVREGQK